MRSGRFLYIKDADRGKYNQRRIVVLCDCGTEKTINYQAFKSGASQSCGCLAKEVQSMRLFKHGMCDTPEYRTWGDMKRRCLNEKTPNYSYYGGRGISICEEWINSFEVFIKDIGPRPFPEYTIDRIDNDGDYTKENCRWADKTTQCINSRVRKDSTTGVKGVGYYKAYDKYRARIMIDGKDISLGYYDTVEKAILIRMKAENKYRSGKYACAKH